MKISMILYLTIATVLMSCTADEATQQEQQGVLSITTSVEDFEGESRTRTNIEGKAFENGDKIKLKIICPFSSHTEFGETTYGNSFDAFWLLKWDYTPKSWVTLEKSDSCDVNGDYSPSAGPNLFERYLAQPTPYVFTAQTWSEEQIFMAGGTRVEQYSNVFHADQSREADYKASDLMWAQTIMQTGSYNIHLSFKHVMSALMVTVVPGEGKDISNDAVLTLEGMPDIDQCEVIVGDYYAAKSKVNSNNYGYLNKHSCTVDENGMALGVAVISDNDKKATRKAFKDIDQTSTYTAYNTDNKIYRLIVPPCTLTKNATFWLRDGGKRYTATLSQHEFVAGKLYNLTINI